MIIFGRKKRNFPRALVPWMAAPMPLSRTKSCWKTPFIFHPRQLLLWLYVHFLMQIVSRQLSIKHLSHIYNKRSEENEFIHISARILLEFILTLRLLSNVWSLIRFFSLPSCFEGLNYLIVVHLLKNCSDFSPLAVVEFLQLSLSRYKNKILVYTFLHLVGAALHIWFKIMRCAVLRRVREGKTILN